MPRKGEYARVEHEHSIEATGRALSLDEKKQDVQNLVNLGLSLQRFGESLVRINDPKRRGGLAEAVQLLQAIIDNNAQGAAEEVREEIFRTAGHKKGQSGGYYKGGTSGQKGGPKF